jgi:hypothetical protein
MLTNFQTFDFERTCCSLFKKRVMFTTFQTFDFEITCCRLFQKRVIAAGTLKIKSLESSEYDAFLE